MRELLFALNQYFVSPLLDIYFIALLVYVVLGWLMVSNVIDFRNMTVRSIYGFLSSIIEPVARPIRNMLPPLGNLDLSVLVIALGIPFVRDWAIPSLIMLVPF